MLKHAVSELGGKIEAAFPGLPNARWVALRLLDGDTRIAEAVHKGELGELSGSRVNLKQAEGSQFVNLT